MQPRSVDRALLAVVVPLWALCFVLGTPPGPVCSSEPAQGPTLAPGPAFVGNIRAVDRWIWSAIGTTTNTAARIQQLTRELGVALLIDEATWRCLGPTGRPFARHPDVAIRGRREAQTLYALEG